MSARNWLDEPGVVLAASSAAPTLPVGNLLTPMRAEVWRTVGAANPTLSVDLGQLRTVRAVVLAAPRDGLLPEGGALAQGNQSLGFTTEGGDTVVAEGSNSDTGAIIEARLGTSAAGGSDAGLIRAPFAMPVGYWCLVLPAAVAARYLRLTMTGSARPYFQAGRLWVCDGLVTRPQDYAGDDQGFVNDALQTAERRTRQFGLSLLPQDDADALESMALPTGTQNQVLVIPRTERADRTAVIGRFATPPLPKLAPGPLGRRYVVTIAVREDR